MSFGIVTPTVGTKFLRQCVESVRGQDCLHYLWVDGTQHREKVDSILDTCRHDNLRVNYLDENVGRSGGEFYGHRVYAACPFLINTDYISFLDEDNWVDPNHIESFRSLIVENRHQWMYSLRKIVNEAGEYICDDNCESLGHWPVQFDKSRFHIDTGCFAIPRNLLVKISHNWMGGWGQDREFFAAMKSAAPDFGCTMKHTMNYRMGSETSRATTEMFLQGNKISWQAYTGERNYPWHEQRNPNTKQSMSFLYQTTSQRQPS